MERLRSKLQALGNKNATKLDEVVDLQVGTKVYAGAPRHLRTELWLSILNSRAGSGLDAKQRYRALLAQGVTELVADEIAKDTKRTFPDIQQLNSPQRQREFQCVLRAYAAYDTEVGYCQGMNFLAGLLLLYVDDPGDAFGLLVVLLRDRRLRELYKPDMNMLQARLWHLNKLMPPVLSVHLEAHAVMPVLYASSWLMTCYASDFPAGFAARVMDTVLCNSHLEPLMKVAVCALRSMERRLLDMDDMEAMIELIKVKLPAAPAENLQRLLSDALNSPWTMHERQLLCEIEGVETVAAALDRIEGGGTSASGDQQQPGSREGSLSGRGRTASGSSSTRPSADGSGAVGADALSPRTLSGLSWAGGAGGGAGGGGGIQGAAAALAVDAELLTDFEERLEAKFGGKGGGAGAGRAVTRLRTKPRMATFDPAASTGAASVPRLTGPSLQPPAPPPRPGSGGSGSVDGRSPMSGSGGPSTSLSGGFGLSDGSSRGRWRESLARGPGGGGLSAVGSPALSVASGCSPRGAPAPAAAAVDGGNDPTPTARTTAAAAAAAPATMAAALINLMDDDAWAPSPTTAAAGPLGDPLTSIPESSNGASGAAAVADGGSSNTHDWGDFEGADDGGGDGSGGGGVPFGDGTSQDQGGRPTAMEPSTSFFADARSAGSASSLSSAGGQGAGGAAHSSSLADLLSTLPDANGSAGVAGVTGGSSSSSRSGSGSGSGGGDGVSRSGGSSSSAPPAFGMSTTPHQRQQQQQQEQRGGAGSPGPALPSAASQARKTAGVAAGTANGHAKTAVHGCAGAADADAGSGGGGSDPFTSLLDLGSVAPIAAAKKGGSVGGVAQRAGAGPAAGAFVGSASAPSPRLG